MKSLTRGEFLKLSLLVTATGAFGHNLRSAGGSTMRKKERMPVPVVHAADLYHPHNDPDDHWDLATLYALAFRGEIDLRGILIDHPVKQGSDPDVMGIAQLNYLTGLAVPCMVGTPYPMKNREDIQADAGNAELRGIEWLMEILRKAGSPVVVNVVGAATGVAVALKREPSLFARKCRAIYLSAGSANGLRDQKLEYNVKLDPPAFAAIFDAPCPVYWMPCSTRTNIGEVGEFGSYYRFTEKEILFNLPRKVQNFFLFMLEKRQSPDWFTYLQNEPGQQLLTRFGESVRHMWSTAGFIHAVGKTVTTDGKIMPSGSAENEVFSFVPVKASCNDNGFVDWELDPRAKMRYIFHVNELTGYRQAMTAALKELVMQLPG